MHENTIKRESSLETAACSAFQRVVYLNVAAGGPKEKEARDEEKKGGCLIEHKRPKVRSFGGFDGQGGVRAQAGSKAGLEIIIPPDHVVTGQLFFYVRVSFLFARVAVMECSFFVQCSFSLYSLSVILMILLAFRCKNTKRLQLLI